MANASDSMRLVPVDLGTPQLAAGDPDRGDALDFTPAPLTVLSAQPRELTNRPPGRDSLDVGDRPDDLEVHLASSLHRSRRTPRLCRHVRAQRARGRLERTSAALHQWRRCRPRPWRPIPPPAVRCSGGCWSAPITVTPRAEGGPCSSTSRGPAATPSTPPGTMASATLPSEPQQSVWFPGTLQGRSPTAGLPCLACGAPGVTRTPGTQFRKLLLYPPELRGRPKRITHLRDGRLRLGLHSIILCPFVCPSASGRHSGEPFEALHPGPEMLRGEVGVAHGHRDVRVPQDLLQVVEVPASHHEVTREGVPQVVEAEPRDAGAGQRRRERRPNLPPRGPVPALEYRPLASRLIRLDLRQRGDRIGVEGDPAGLAAFRPVERQARGKPVRSEERRVGKECRS